MAIFGKTEARDDKQARKAQELIEKYGLTNLDAQSIEAVKRICAELAGNNLMTVGITLSGRAEDVAKISLLRAMVEQNWIIIKQLDAIMKSLDK